MRPWGRDDEEVECYGVDLDALYVNTDFRVAVLDVLRGPKRTGLESVCRYAAPEEFHEAEEEQIGWFSSFGRKKKQQQRDSEDVDTEGGDDISGTEGGGTALERSQSQKKKGGGWWGGKKRAAAAAAAQEEKALVRAAQRELQRQQQEARRAGPEGNWLWQLVTEVIPSDFYSDCTDILSERLPPAHNRHRNPKCHPTRGTHLVCAV